jgi:hypothetical protein
LFKTGWERKPRGQDGKILPDPPKEEKQVEAETEMKAAEEASQ